MKGCRNNGFIVKMIMQLKLKIKTMISFNLNDITLNNNMHYMITILMMVIIIMIITLHLHSAHFKMVRDHRAQKRLLTPFKRVTNNILQQNKSRCIEGYAALNRLVLTPLLKASMEEARLTSVGRGFQRDGATNAKQRLGTLRIFLVSDRRGLVRVCRDSIWEGYTGALFNMVSFKIKQQHFEFDSLLDRQPM